MQEARFRSKGTVIDIYILILHIGSTCPEIIEVADTILVTSVCDDLTIIDWCLRTTACDITIEHTVHHHGLLVISNRSGSHIIMSYDTTYLITTGDIGITEAVNDA